MFHFKYQIVNDGVELYLEENKRNLFFKKISEKISTSSWTKDYEHKASGIAKVLLASEQGIDVKPIGTDDGYWLSNSFIASLSEHQANAIGLPEAIPYQLRTELTGPIFNNETLLNHSWHDKIGRLINAKQQGAFLVVGVIHYRIPDPIYSSLISFNNFNEIKDASFDERMLALSGLQKVIGETDQVDWDTRLNDLRMSHASSFSLSISVEEQALKINPVLFSKDTIERFSEEGKVPDEKDQMLTQNEQENFLNKHFNHSPVAKKSYALSNNHFVFIDPMLRDSLEALKHVQNSDQEIKKQFVRSPVSFIKEFIPDSDLIEKNDAIESVFIETNSFSDRVIEIGLWVPPSIPVLNKKKGAWSPDSLMLKIGDEIFSINEQDLEPLKNKIIQAKKAGLDRVKHSQDEQEFEIGTDDQTLESIDTLINFKDNGYELSEDINSVKGQADNGLNDVPEDLKPEKKVLIIEDNVEEFHFARSYQERTSFNGFEMPLGLINKPKDHQVEGIEWIQELWSRGYPGALLADDMGLGKTFQTIAFFSWLYEKLDQNKQHKYPILIVAPVSLLGNWAKEVEMHLDTSVLGTPTTLYGNLLHSYRVAGVSKKGNDITLGRSVLDVNKLSKSKWILTTYETVRDYQFSFGSMKFSCVVFDEMQKIKNPKSGLTNASKALNSDFTIGLTGTPIENSMIDLWTIMDTLIPGCFGLRTLKEFAEEYSADKVDNLKKLSNRLLKRKDDLPPPILRRMKSDIAKDLPKKIEQPLIEEMKPAQADAYKKCIDMRKAEQIDALTMIQSLKKISIHSEDIDSEMAEDANKYVNGSSKYIALFKILDEAYSKNEKVLVFVEYKNLHEWLSVYIKHRYKMNHFPNRIFGSVSAEERTNIVERFQEAGSGFDLLLLSPKAAGVGLTLTAASKVVHFTRWWNPAVEDQCTDRAYRIGQKNDVTVYYPISEHPIFGEGSFDFILDALLNQKRSLSKEVLMPVINNQELENIEDKLINLTQ